MKSIISTASCVALLAYSLYAQNIPTANWTGPWGVQVNTWNGNLYLDRTDLAIPNQGVFINFSFHYNSFRDTIDLGFGKGWTSTYSFRYYPDSTGIVIERPDGRTDFFNFSGGVYKSPTGIFDRLEEYVPSKFRLTTKSGMKYYFEDPVRKYLTKIEDTNGNTLTVGLFSVTDPSGRTVQFSLSPDGAHLGALVDNNGPQRLVIYSYDGEGHLTKVRDPEGGEIKYEYDDKGQLNKIINEKGDILTLRYNAAGAVEEVATCIAQAKFHYNPEQRKTYIVEKNASGDQLTTYAYDEDGRLLSKTGACCGYNTAYGYDTDNNLSQLTDANGNKILANHDGNGNALIATDPLAAQQSFAYEPTYNHLTSLKDKNGNQTQMQYNPAGNLTAIQLPGNINVGMAYSPNGNLASMTDGKGNPTLFSYNANNEVETIQYPIGTETYQYDGVGNLVQSIDANNNQSYFAYDGLNRLLGVADMLGNTVLFEYDAASNLTKETDANTNQKTYEYDAHNRLAAVNTLAGTTRYTYDASDNLIAITDANGHTTRFRYDARNLLTEETDPLGHRTTYTHDGNGNVLTRTDPNGNVTEYSYDALNRLVRKTYPGNTDNYRYDANGNLTQCSNNHVSMTFSYDALNRLTSKTIDNWGKTIQYAYDNNGNRISMIDPNGGPTLYEYDANDRLTKITNPAGQVTQFFYDLGGRITELRHHNGTRALYTYDNANRLLSLNYPISIPPLVYSYTYDNNGNRLSAELAIDASPVVDFAYLYDGDNRLLSSKDALSGIEEQYTFDSTGNRTQLVLNSVTTDYNYDEADRLQIAGAVAFQYDDNGNQTRRAEGAQEAQYEFDGENRLIRAVMPTGVEVRYQYDPFGNRISQRVNGVETRYFLDGDNVLMELDANGNTTARYTSALTLDSWLVMQRGGQSYCYHTDGLGSVTALTDNTQNIAEFYLYDSYGNLLSGDVSGPNPYRFTGREYDVATGLYYYRTRYYDAREGRFLTSDQFRGFQRRPLSLNKYTYAECNPVNFTDSEGRFIWGVILNVIEQTSGNFIKYGKNWHCYTYKLDLFDLLTGGISIVKHFKAKHLKDGIAHLERGIESAHNRFKVGDGKYIRKLIKTLDKYKKKLENIENEFEEGFESLDQLSDYLEDALGIDFTLVEIKLDEKGCKAANGEGNQNEEPIDPPTDLPTEQDDKPDIEIPIIRSVDPNEIIAPPGVGAEKWVSATATLPYTIWFENDPDFATAAAQRVVIEHTLDSDLNPYAFRLGDFGFGSWYFEVPDNVSYYTTRIDLADTFGVWVDVLAGIDVSQRRAFWIFESVDPATGLAASLPAETGFLPVNDTTTRSGEGFVNFAIRAAVTSVTGSKIDAQASIVFDDNPPIPTNVAFNTLDADAPTSGITIVEPVANGTYNLVWGGSDVGSGLESYTLHVSTNNGPFLPTIADLTGTGYTFTGQPDSAYRFFTIARDSVGNVELLKYTGEPSCMTVTVVNLVDAPLGSTNGSATLSVTGNNGALTYTWSHDPTLNGPVATGLAPGNYTVFVEDAAGCQVAVSFTVKALVGTGEAIAGLMIHRIYPVPTSGLVSVEFSAPVRTVYIQVLNTAGRMVLQQNVQPGLQERSIVTLDLSDQASGAYTIRVLTPQGSVVGIVIKE